MLTTSTVPFDDLWTFYIHAESQLHITNTVLCSYNLIPECEKQCVHWNKTHLNSKFSLKYFSLSFTKCISSSWHLQNINLTLLRRDRLMMMDIFKNWIVVLELASHKNFESWVLATSERQHIFASWWTWVSSWALSSSPWHLLSDPG